MEGRQWGFMGIVNAIREMSRAQRRAFMACFLGWSLDAFDFFILTFCLDSIAANFHTGRKEVSVAVSLTLMMRPVGALLFGLMAERFGRRPTLMVNIVCFSVFELASAFAPTLGALIVCRALFGIAMGGEWGVGAALALETLPAKGRGYFSGILQEGYSVGNMMASLLFLVLFPHLHGTGLLVNWRVMFMVGAAPALLVLYIRSKVEESPAWLRAKAEGHQHKGGMIPPGSKQAMQGHWGQAAMLVVMMFGFMSLSHGTQDLYPSFLRGDRHLSLEWIGVITWVSSAGMILGGITWGGLSERIGRRKAIILSTLLTVPLLPLWGWTHTPWVIACGGFLMQFMVQGAWGVVPAHLNELSPGAVRAVMPGLVYQLGALLSSWNIRVQTGVAERYNHGALAPVLSWTVMGVAVILCATTALAGEARGVEMGRANEAPIAGDLAI